MAALDLFEGSLVQQSVEEERVLMPLPSYIHPQGQDLGPSAAMLSTEADASLNISTEPVVLHSQSSLKRAIFGLTSFISFSRLSDLTASAAPAASPMQTQADTAAPPVTTPPETPLSVNHSSEASLGSQLFSKVSAGSRLLPAHSFIPGLLCSFKPTLTAVQPLEQPMFDTTSHLTNPIIGQEELAGEDGTHSSSVKFGAVDASPTSSSGVRGLLATNTSSLAEAIERESAADKAARQEADEVFLEKTNKPKALLRISSSVVDFTIKAFRLSNNVEVPNNNNEEQQAAASEREQIGAKVKKKMAVRFVPVALGGSPRLYVTPSGLIGLTEQADC
ncbi:MAG: hypothetical protein FRX49_13584 [Trebouxia sp. A1-2]|nr:MAG: hypothetical protein FRX49_13584 [Trebouxia sp. A1-2]